MPLMGYGFDKKEIRKTGFPSHFLLKTSSHTRVRCVATSAMCGHVAMPCCLIEWAPGAKLGRVQECSGQKATPKPPVRPARSCTSLQVIEAVGDRGGGRDHLVRARARA
jgi:hypothetical protein